jgi:uncharacterized protein (TIGR03435 family)
VIFSVAVQRGLLLAAVLGLSGVVAAQQPALSAPQKQDSPPTQQPGASQRLTFEVATIRLAKPDSDGGIHPLPGNQEYWARDVPVQLIVSLMWKLPLHQVVGGPGWVSNEGYDVEAKAEQPTTLDNLHIMFQNLLVDRFHLKYHMETRQGPVYALTVDKGGVKMARDAAEEAWSGKYPVEATGRAEFTGKQVTMKYFSYWLGLMLQRDERPVLDETGLKGTWDFTLKFLPELPPNMSRDQLPPDLANLPSIFDALPEQLGLRLRPAQGPVQYLVIDQIDRPTAN